MGSDKNRASVTSPVPERDASDHDREIENANPMRGDSLGYTQPSAEGTGMSKEDEELVMQQLTDTDEAQDTTAEEPVVSNDDDDDDGDNNVPVDTKKDPSPARHSQTGLSWLHT